MTSSGRGGRGDAEDGAGAHDAQDQQQRGAARDEVAPPADHGPGDGAGQEEHGLDGGGTVRALPEARGDLRQRGGDHAGVQLEGQHAQQQGGDQQGGAAAGELGRVVAGDDDGGASLGGRRGCGGGWGVHIKLLCSSRRGSSFAVIRVVIQPCMTHKYNHALHFFESPAASGPPPERVFP